MEPLPLEGWEIELTGLIRPFRVVLRAEDLPEMEQVEHEMILQCSGNGRNRIRRHPGNTLESGRSGQRPLRGRSALGNSREAQRHGRSPGQVRDRRRPRRAHGTREAGPRAQHPGGGRPGERDSRPEAQRRALPGIHGGPVRLVTPGLFGTMQIKWLARLRFETAESPNFYHATEYRVPYRLLKPGEKFRFTLENSRPTWDIRLMSYILYPEPGGKTESRPRHRQRRRLQRRQGTHRVGAGVVRSRAEAGSRRSSRYPTVPMPGTSGRLRADTQARHPRDLGAGHRRSRSQPTARRQDLLEPERLRVDRCVQGSGDRAVAASAWGWFVPPSPWMTRYCWADTGVPGDRDVTVPDKVEAAGPWDHSALAKFREWEPSWVDRCLEMSADPWISGVLPRKDVELISIAVNAACTNLSAEGTRRHIRWHSTPARPAKRS